MRYSLIFFMLFISMVSRAQEGANFNESDLFASLEPNDRAALLMVHFGTTHDDTRALTIEVINEKARDAFKGVEIREAWTSRIVMRRMRARGVERLNPVEALKQLEADGFTHVLIQSTNIIEGIEMESLRKDAASMRASFKDIRIGNPLLYAPEDYEVVIKAITGNGAREGATLLVGHGTYTPATAQYAMLDYMLKEKGFKHFSVGTIEGYPSFDSMEAQVKANGDKKVLLVPLMFVAGDHAKNDIAGEWKDELEKRGYQVEVLLEGLGQNPVIQDLFIDHARFMAKHKKVDIVDKKKAYALGDAIE